MRRLAALLALGLVMALLSRFTAAAPLEARATLALGLLLLAAALAGDLAQRAALPRLTGFLLAGLVMGPPGLELLRADEIGALRVALDAALVLIAFDAGSEIRARVLRQHARALTRATGAALLAPLLAVTAFVLLVSPWFPLAVHQPWGDRITIALALGALAAASSPAIAIGLVHELRAHGPAARLLLTVIATKEAAVVAVVALTLVGGRLVGSSGVLEPAALWRAPALLGGSLALGAGLGVGVSLALRLVAAGVVLPIFALLGAAAAGLYGCEALLIGLAAGAVVTNVTGAAADRMVGALRREGVLVYALYFGLAGAGLQLGALAVWPWVLALVAVRALGLRYGLRWAGRDPGVPPRLVQPGWLGLTPQAGVAVGLAAVVRRAFPEWGVSLEAFVLAMIGVQEVAGPLVARLALQRAGEEARNGEARESGGLAMLSRTRVQ